LQKQCKKRPDSEWIEEKQHEIEDLRAQMERDQEAMKDYKHCTNHKWQEMESEKDVLKRNAEELKRDLSTKEQVVNELTEKVRQQSKELESVGFQNITLESQVRDLEAVNIKVKKQVNDERLKKDEELKELKVSFLACCRL
jgi:chromosome segregation ATPase